MPELPEVETVRRDLAASVVGALVASVSVTGLRSTRRHPDPSAFVDGLTGQALVGFRRWGKYLIVELAPGPSVLVAHLRMSGQLRLAASRDVPLAPHSHVVLTFVDGRQLRFVDPRTFGELFVTSPSLPELAGLGPDALDVDIDCFAARLTARRTRLKALLLDQRFVAGIGNIYSDEILWTSRLRWSRPANQLRPVEVRRLHAAMVSVLGEAVSLRGSSLGDKQYVDLAGRGGGFQERHAVYGHLGDPCPRCGHRIERTVVAQRSHFWCRGCQK